jgi:hypothetical protein
VWGNALKRRQEGKEVCKEMNSGRDIDKRKQDDEWFDRGKVYRGVQKNVLTL